MLEALFFLDKIVLGWLSNPANVFPVLTGLWLTTEILATKNKKKGGK